VFMQFYSIRLFEYEGGRMNEEMINIFSVVFICGRNQHGGTPSAELRYMELCSVSLSRFALNLHYISVKRKQICA
jgi:hypothetical protein